MCHLFTFKKNLKTHALVLKLQDTKTNIRNHKSVNKPPKGSLRRNHITTIRSGHQIQAALQHNSDHWRANGQTPKEILPNLGLLRKHLPTNQVALLRPLEHRIRFRTPLESSVFKSSNGGVVENEESSSESSGVFGKQHPKRLLLV